MTTIDPTAQQAHHNAQSLSPQQKLDGLFAITKTVGTAMLTSRSPDGKLASRAMVPASTEGFGECCVARGPDAAQRDLY